MFHVQSALAYSGLVAAVVLLTASQNRGLAIVSLLAAAFEVLTQLGLLRLQVAHLHLGLVLGLVLAVPALIIWFKATTKAAITAAAIAALVGVIQVVAYAIPRA